MMKKFFLMMLSVGLLAGCVHETYRGETFTPTSIATFYPDLASVPGHYRIIGFAKLVANAGDSSNNELRDKALAMGEKHGAQGVIILGSELVFAGTVVDASRDLSLESSGMPMNQFMAQQQWEVDTGSFGLDRIKKFNRVMYACFIRFAKADKMR